MPRSLAMKLLHTCIFTILIYSLTSGQIGKENYILYTPICIKSPQTGLEQVPVCLTCRGMRLIRASLRMRSQKPSSRSIRLNVADLPRHLIKSRIFEVTT